MRIGSDSGVALPAHRFADEDRDDFRAGLVIESEHESEGWGERADPLPNRDLWNDMIHEPCGARDHAFSLAGRTRATPARQADEPLEGAHWANLPSETKLEAAARQDTFELSPHEPRQRSVRGFYFGDERGEVLVEHLVEHRLGRVPGTIFW